MTKNRFKWSAIVTALVAASLASGVALAADENESAASGTCNNTLGQAMPLEFDGSGVAVVNGSMINGFGWNNGCDTWAASQYRDVDFYSFQASQGDDIDIAISNAWNGSYTWTILGVFGPRDSSGHYPLRSQAPLTTAPSISPFHADAPGMQTYYVGVSSYPGMFVSGAYGDGKLVQYSLWPWSPSVGVRDGTYTLTVKGAKPKVLAISIDVKPGNNTTTVLDASGVAQPMALRGTARGHLPVALLSSEKDEFYPMEVNQGTLRFGATGKEESLVRCNGGHGQDVNNDGIPDLICHFDLKKANFALSDGEGTLTGQAGDGRDFEGKGWLKTVTLGLTPKKLGFDRK